MVKRFLIHAGATRRFFGAGAAAALGFGLLITGPALGAQSPIDLADADARFDGGAAFDNSGQVVAGTGDINGDGHDDLLIGAPNAGNNDRVSSGSSFVVFGSATPTGTFDLGSLDTAGFRIDGAAAYDYSGWAVAGAGDVNDDGYDDLLIGAPFASKYARDYSGSSYVVFGNATPTDIDLADLDTAGFRIDGGAAYDNSGYAVAGAGDVDDDGYDDLLIGANNAGTTGRDYSGASYVVFGSETPTNVDLADLGPAGFRVDGAAEYDFSGSAVAGSGDVNDDGYADLLISAPSAGNNDRSGSGSSYVVFGGETPSDVDLADLGTAGFRIDGATAGDQSGSAVAGAGDVNGDGDDDVLIGAPYVGYNPSLAEHAPGARNVSRTDSGASYVVFGSDSPTDIDLADLGPAGFCIDGATGDFSGRAVAGLGDVNGDDLDDLLIGAPEAGNNDRDSSGSSYVVFGSEESPDVDLADLGNGGFRIDGTAASDNSGSAVAGAGDVNDDGSNDLLIGAPYAGNNDRDDSGSSYLLLGTYTTPGAPTGVSGTPGDAQVQLSWTAPAFDGGAISGYQIETKTSGTPWTIATANTGTSATNHTVTGLTNGTTYQFRVAAINPAGTGPASEPSDPVTPRTTPSAPNGVTGTPGDGHVQLLWTAPATDGGAAISGYQIESRTGGGLWAPITANTGTTTTHRTITGLINGTAYQFRIAAINPAGTGPASEPSGDLIPTAGVTPPPPVTPTAILAVAARKASKSVPKTGKATLVSNLLVGPGQAATISVTVQPKKTKKKVKVATTATTVKVRTKRAPKGTVTVTITAAGTGFTPATWTRTWKVR